MLLREGANLLAVSCWDEEGPARAALEPLLDRVASSSLDALLAKPLSCRRGGGPCQDHRSGPGPRSMSPRPRAGAGCTSASTTGVLDPGRVAESVLIEVPRAEQPPSARDAYAVLVSRLDRRSWRVRVIDRASGVVARSEWFEDEAAARRRRDELSADADALDAAAFRSRYRLP